MRIFVLFSQVFCKSEIIFNFFIFKYSKKEMIILYCLESRSDSCPEVSYFKKLKQFNKILHEMNEETLTGKLF